MHSRDIQTKEDTSVSPDDPTHHGKSYYQARKTMREVDEPFDRIFQLQARMSEWPYTGLISNLRRGAIVLDVCCGDGPVAAFLSIAGFDVVAFDYSQDACRDALQTVQTVNQWAAQHQAKVGVVEVFEKSIEEFDLSDVVTLRDQSSHGFDCIVLHDVLHQWPPSSLPTIRSRILDWLKPGGILFVCVKSRKHELYGKGTRVEEHVFEYRQGRKVHYFDERDLEGMFLNPSVQSGIRNGARMEHISNAELQQPKRRQFEPEQLEYSPWAIYSLTRLQRQ
jgi:SAM-dependent methyltransferase